MLPALLIFDVDETLTESKQPLQPSMAAVLTELLHQTHVAIISGGKYEIMRAQVADRLPEDADRSHLFLLPTSGSALYAFQDNEWKNIYKEHLTDEESIHITAVLEEKLRETGVVDLSVPSYGERIENRGSQITLSALGQQAPLEEKLAWDPTGEKRDVLRDAIAQVLPAYDVKRGGTTSIDITKHGINKGFGVRRISEYLKLPIAAMLYIGDALFPGGNDEVVKETGIATQKVVSPYDTEEFLKDLLHHE